MTDPYRTDAKEPRRIVQITASESGEGLQWSRAVYALDDRGDVWCMSSVIDKKSEKLEPSGWYKLPPLPQEQGSK